MNAAALSFVLVLAGLSLAGCARPGMSPPQGWRAPNAMEAADHWRSANVGRYLEARGSFTGAGRNEVARILISDDGSTFGVFVFSAADSGRNQIVTLFESKDANLVHSMGIETVGPGNYVTACGKGYWDCGKDESEHVVLAHDAIRLFKREGHSSLLYKDLNSEAFKRIWVSD
ncbi:hypothetical protein [Fundidesulfovibrio soli]|uniref:hypothetical protein n=1 Tax=Fundidesulfovibrio soli TaxID=2922716 RepID=UPI001FB02ED7|nr:hypothetical protein [Fundidesulfovibrio soli]